MGQHPCIWSQTFFLKAAKKRTCLYRATTKALPLHWPERAPWGLWPPSLSTPLIFLSQQTLLSVPLCPKRSAPYSGKGSLGSGLFLSPFPFFLTLLRVPISAGPRPSRSPQCRHPTPQHTPPSRPPFRSPLFSPPGAPAFVARACF